MILSITIGIFLLPKINISDPWFYPLHWKLEYEQMGLANKTVVPGFELELSKSKKQTVESSG